MKPKLRKLAVVDTSINAGAKPKVDEVGSSGTSLKSGVYSEEFLLDLQGQKAAQTYDKMRRRETQVSMILDAVKNPILGANWTIEVEDETDPKQLEMKTLIEWNFENGLLDGFKQHLKEALTLLDFGFSVFEFVHATENVTALGKLTTYYKKFGFRKQVTVTKWNLEKGTGKLLSVEQEITSDTAKEEKAVIPGEYLLVLTNKKEGDNLEGISLLRPMFGAYSRKDLYLKLTAIGAERYNIGVVKGTTPANKATTAEDTAFDTMLAAYAANEIGYIKVPEGWNVETLKVDFDPSKMVPLLTFENEEMARAVVASFLMLGTGGNGGAYALGSDLSDFFLGGIQSYADIICEGHNRLTIPQLCEMNFGPQPTYPKLRCTGINDKAGKELADIILSLVNSRSLTPDAKLEDFLRSQYKLPDVEPETARTAAASASALQPVGQGGGATDQTEGVVSTDGQPGAGTTGADAAPGTGAATGDVRKETLNGAQVTAAVAIIQAVASGQMPRDAALATLQIAFNLTPEQADQMLGSAGNGFEPSTPPPSNTPPDNNPDPTPPGGGGGGADKPKPELQERLDPKQLAEQRALLAEGYKAQFNASKAATKAIMLTAVRGMGDNLKTKLEKNWNSLPESRKVDAVKGVAVSPGLVNAYKAQLRDQLAKVADGAIKQARKEVPKAAAKAEFADYDPWAKMNPLVKRAITAQVGLIADTQAADMEKLVLFQFSSSSLSRSEIDGILQDVEEKVQGVLDGTPGAGLSIDAGSGNVVAQVTQNSRNEFFFSPDVLDTLESFTFFNEDPVSEICQNLNGQTFAANDPAAEAWYPPLHHNCKSRLIPNEKGSNEEITGIGVTADTVEERQRIERQATLSDCCKHE